MDQGGKTEIVRLEFGRSKKRRPWHLFAVRRILNGRIPTLRSTCFGKRTANNPNLRSTCHAYATFSPTTQNCKSRANIAQNISMFFLSILFSRSRLGPSGKQSKSVRRVHAKDSLFVLPPRPRPKKGTTCETNSDFTIRNSCSHVGPCTKQGKS